MSIFPFRNKEKPDIPKDAPKKTGIRLVASTVWREFFGLLKLNLLFLLASLPVVTIPAAIKAMSRITLRMVRDENYFLWHDFWVAFKDDFWKSFFGGLLFLVAFALFTLSIIVYWIFGTEVHWALLIFASLSLALLLWAYIASLYFFPMNAYVELTFWQLLKNSVLLVFSGWKRSGLVLVSVIVFLFAAIALLPYSAVYLAFIGFSLTNLLVSFAVYPVIEKRTVRIESEEETETVLDPAELQSATFKGWDDEEETVNESEEDSEQKQENEHVE